MSHTPFELTTELAEALVHHAKAFAKEHHCPTISDGLWCDGRLVSAGGTVLHDDGFHPTTESVYRIASMTKSFTAAAVLSLRDEGVLSLDDRIDLHAPELASVRGPVDDAGPIRIRHLLTMTAGLVTDNPWADRHLDIDDEGMDAIVRDGVVWSGTTGTSFDYSNLGFGLLGRVVKRATGRRVQDLITERFLEPLGLTRTTWVQPDHDDWARPSRWRDGAWIPEGLEPLGDGEIAPMGGLWSTVDDVGRWVTFLSDAFPSRDGADEGPLSRASRREMQEMHRFTSTMPLPGRTAVNGYGYGLRIRNCNRMGRVVGHSGGLPGYGSHMRWAVERGLAVVALSNVTYAPMAQYTQDVFELVLAHGAFPTPLPFEAPLVDEYAHRLVALLGDWDDAVADELFADNVAPDEPYDRLRAQAAEWLATCGGRFEIDHVVATTKAAGRIFVKRPEGDPFEIQFKLSPAGPPRIQKYAELDDT
ncbi:MAG: serine hydrolase domain-containing protein [Acidimicrobiales bacterium]